MRKMFISYVSEKAYSNCTIELEDDELIDDINGVQSLQTHIAESQNLKKVVILNMIMLPIK